MFSELVQYQGKAGFFKFNFLKSSKYWQVRARSVFAQTVIYNLHTCTAMSGIRTYSYVAMYF